MIASRRRHSTTRALWDAAQRLYRRAVTASEKATSATCAQSVHALGRLRRRRRSQRTATRARRRTRMAARDALGLLHRGAACETHMGRREPRSLKLRCWTAAPLEGAL